MSDSGGRMTVTPEGTFSRFIKKANDRQKAYSDIKLYLLSHEQDIATGLNDFGNLEFAFIDLIGREPMIGGEG